MIHITSEGNLFTSFCNSVVGTANFHHLTVTALIQFSIQSFLFLLVNCNLFAILKKKKKTKKKKKKKKQCCRIVSVFFCVPCLFQESIFSGLKILRQAV